MERAAAEALIDELLAGRVTRASALETLATAPFRDLGFARVDTHRALRDGLPEVILGQGKTPEQIVAIAREVLADASRLLVTRVDTAQLRALRDAVPALHHHADARLAWFDHAPRRTGLVAVVSAGTADIPVAEEAAITAELAGARVERIYDVGVAGIHRLLARVDDLRRANAVVAVAGMEGALPSVVGGLVANPVIAVPTSIGYGTSFQGLAALLAMLNSCAAGVTVVNIDNGFGAGYAAARINRLAMRAPE
jgi:hypothetical protein